MVLIPQKPLNIIQTQRRYLPLIYLTYLETPDMTGEMADQENEGRK